MKKRHKNINLGDKKSQTREKTHKNLNLNEKKSQHSLKKTQKFKSK